MLHKIEVYLRGGTNNGYVVQVPMNAQQVEVDAEQYKRTNDLAKVKCKGGLVESYRVYEVSDVHQ